jgi:hypothetical protein
MSEIPPCGTPGPVVHDGFVTDRETAERIWDTARREARAEFEEAMVAATERQTKLERLVDLLEEPKSAKRDAEIKRLKAELGLE